MKGLQERVKLYPKSCGYVHFRGKVIIFAFVQFPEKSMSQRRSTIISQRRCYILFFKLVLGPILAEADLRGGDGNQKFLSLWMIFMEGQIWN